MRLDRKIQFQRGEPYDDGYGTKYRFVDHGPKISAFRLDVSDGEKATIGWVESTNATRFVIRNSAFSRDLTPNDRIAYDGRDWNIKGIKETRDGRLAYLEITAEARANV